MLNKKDKVGLDIPDHVKREMELNQRNKGQGKLSMPFAPGIYTLCDWDILPGYHILKQDIGMNLRTLEDLLNQDLQREADGFRRRIRLGKLVKPTRDKKSKVVVVPTTTEPKFYHDDSISKDEEETGGSGEGDEGEVIGQQKAQPQPGEGEGQGAGQGDGSGHDISSEAFDLGRVLTQKFALPNIKEKGKKRALNKYTYDLTDINRGHGQLLEKKATLKRIVETNILLGNIESGIDIDPSKFIFGPNDLVYRILSAEKDYETQAVVFFVRDYSGSMQGKPTEVITSQHLLIYSWLMYQYQNNVMVRFIVHDTEAKEVPDFYNYYQLQVAGGTRVAPAFKMVNDIIEKERLASEYNIYVFYGTDGDDWDNDGKEMLEQLQKLISVANRTGFTVAKNGWTGDAQTTVEKNIASSGIAEKHHKLFRIDGFQSDGVSEDRILEGIKKLIS